MQRLVQFVRGLFAIISLSVNTIFWFPFLLLVALFKLLIPLKKWRFYCTQVLNLIGETWCTINIFNIMWLMPVTWEIGPLPPLDRDSNYLILANHQSWTDIVVLQKIFNKKVPFFKFFLKKELKLIPVLGLAWWAMDYPFMHRYSKAVLKKKPHLKGKDVEVTRKACEKFDRTAVTIVNFLEGTRFTAKKHERQKSPFTHLLRPKAGGIAYVLGAMGEKLTAILDITIIYPEGPPSFWSFLCGRLTKIKVIIKARPIEKKLIGNYAEDEKYRTSFQEWVNSIWGEKDRLLDNELVP